MIGRANKILKVGLTGSPKSGKSTALKFFQQLGAYTFSADSCLHDAYLNNKHLQGQLVKLFGPGILSEGKINRNTLAHIVFSQPNQLKKLESVTHPFVFEQMKRAYAAATTPFVAEIPLLFESKAPFATWFDTTINVERDIDEAKNSFLSSGKSEKEFEARLAHFLPLDERREKSTFTLKNFGSLVDLQNEVKIMYNHLNNQ